MKAAIYEQYGPPEVLQLVDVEKPSPGDDEVLVNIRSTTVSAADWRLRKADPFLARLFNGLLKPTKAKILGMELAGIVDAVGKNVTHFKVGDSVFGSGGFTFGAYAEYICVHEGKMVLTMPTGLSFDEAAAVPFGAVSALHFLRKANIQKGDKVLVYGASGSVGVFAVQLAKVFGADVTAVCSTDNLKPVKSLGADQVIDYTQREFPDGKEIFDVIIDTVGKSSYSRCIKSLGPKGIYLLVAGSPWSLIRGLWTSKTSGKKVIGGTASGDKSCFEFLKQLIEAGDIKPVIDRRYPIEQIADAHRYVEKGHKKGAVVITLNGNDQPV